MQSRRFTHFEYNSIFVDVCLKHLQIIVPLTELFVPSKQLRRIAPHQFPQLPDLPLSTLDVRLLKFKFTVAANY